MNQRIPLTLLATRTLVPHGQLDLHPDLQVLLYRAGFQQLSPHPVLVPRIIPSQVQDPAFALWISDCSLPISPLCWGLSGGLHSPLEYHPLLPALRHQGTCWAGLCPFIWVIDEQVKRYWVQYWTLGDTTGDRHWSVPLITDSLGSAFQPVLTVPSDSPLVLQGCNWKSQTKNSIAYMTNALHFHRGKQTKNYTVQLQAVKVKSQQMWCSTLFFFPVQHLTVQDTTAPVRYSP